MHIQAAVKMGVLLYYFDRWIFSFVTAVKLIGIKMRTAGNASSAFPAVPGICYFIAAKAPSRAVIRSSMCSVPIDRRIVLGLIPCSASSASLSCE